MQRYTIILLGLLLLASMPNLWAQTQPAPPPPPPPPAPVPGAEFEARMAAFEADMEAWSQKMEGWGREMADWGQEMEAWGAKMEAWGEKMERFGSELKDMLEEDGLIDEDQANLELKFYEDYMTVYGERVEGQQYEKYRKLLDKYEVEIGPDGGMIFNPPFKDH